MKRIFVIFSLTLAFSGSVLPAKAESPEPDPETVMLCQKTDLAELEIDCASIIEAYESYKEAQLLEENSFYPPDPLESSPVDPEFGDTDILYAKVISPKAAVYSSLDDARNKKNPKRFIYDGFNYVSYLSKVTKGGKEYYYIGNSEWMKGADLNPNIHPIAFSGLVIEYAPQRPFGWSLHNSPTYKEPGYGNERSGLILPRHAVFEVYDTKVISGWEWYLVGEGQWIEQRRVALVYPGAEAPEGVKNGRWIEVNLFEQTLAAYENNQIVFATLVTTGSAEFYTRPGLFKIWLKLTSTSMRGGDEDDKYWLEDVLWTMYFDEARGLHGEYWHDHLGYKSSHGCVNLAFADADWLFQWADKGDWVYVWDPSGKTPVEPHLFTHLIPPPLPEIPLDFPVYLHE